MKGEWKAINRDTLHKAIRRLYQSRLVEGRNHSDGSVTLVLSEEGKRRALTFSMDTMRIPKPRIWDGKWRLVIFDVPEHQKKLRDAIRGHLKRLNFYELQKSVFIHPYPCKDEVDFLVEFYSARSYVRQLVAEWVDNELHLKHKFRIG